MAKKRTAAEEKRRSDLKWFLIIIGLVVVAVIAAFTFDVKYGTDLDKVTCTVIETSAVEKLNPNGKTTRDVWRAEMSCGEFATASDMTKIGLGNKAYSEATVGKKFVCGGWRSFGILFGYPSFSIKNCQIAT